MDTVFTRVTTCGFDFGRIATAWWAHTGPQAIMNIVCSSHPLQLPYILPHVVCTMFTSRPNQIITAGNILPNVGGRAGFLSFPLSLAATAAWRRLRAAPRRFFCRRILRGAGEDLRRFQLSSVDLVAECRYLQGVTRVPGFPCQARPRQFQAFPRLPVLSSLNNAPPPDLFTTFWITFDRRPQRLDGGQGSPWARNGSDLTGLDRRRPVGYVRYDQEARPTRRRRAKFAACGMIRLLQQFYGIGGLLG